MTSHVTLGIARVCGTSLKARAKMRTACSSETLVHNPSDQYRQWLKLEASGRGLIKGAVLRDLNQRPAEYEARVLTTGLLRFVAFRGNGFFILVSCIVTAVNIIWRSIYGCSLQSCIFMHNINSSLLSSFERHWRAIQNMVHAFFFPSSLEYAGFPEAS
jgi:hypothetical protein